MRSIKNIFGMIILCSVIFVLSSPNAMAGGGINWKVNITNNTEYKARVKVFVEKSGFGDELHSTVDVPAGGTVTVETGALCPDSLCGHIYNKKWANLRGMALGTGRTFTEPCGDWTKGTGAAACWDSTVRIEKLVDDKYQEFRDYDYGFKK